MVAVVALAPGTNFPPLGATYYSIFNTGAIGDGTSHPLSQFFATLTQAQQTYPDALSLNEEIDYAAVRKAMDFVIAQGGGTVFIPYGTFMMNNASDPSCFLEIPECTPSGVGGTQLNFQGCGWHNSILRWPTDVGSLGSNFAVSCGDPTGNASNQLGRYAGTGLYEGFLADMQLAGPVTSMAKGVVGANLAGFAWGARRRMYRVQCRGFYAGVSLVGDWAYWESVYTPDCYYGIYFPQVSAFLFGNIEFQKCMFQSCAMAAIALASTGYIRGTFDSCYIGTSPYSIMMEVGTGSGSQILSRWKDCQFEGYGNALLADLNAITGLGGSGTKILTLERCMFEGCSAVANGTVLTTSGQGAFSMFSCHEMKDVVIEQFSALSAGSNCVFDVDLVQGISVTFESMNSFLAGLAVPFLLNATTSTAFEVHDSALRYSGRVVRMGVSATAAVGNVLEYANGRAVLAIGTTTNPVIGIATSVATASQYIVAWTCGGRITVTSNGTLTSNEWVKKGATAGLVDAATDVSDGYTVGYTESASAGTCLVDLSQRSMAGSLF